MIVFENFILKILLIRVGRYTMRMQWINLRIDNNFILQHR